MLKVKYNNSNVYNSIEVFRRLNEHVVGFDLSVKNISGFKTYEDDQELGDFSDYTFLYKAEENMTWYSNDGSAYVEPVEDIEFNVIWNDGLGTDRPTRITAKNNLGADVVFEAPGWNVQYKDVPVKDQLELISAEELPGYSVYISENTIHYSKDVWKEEVEKSLINIDSQLLYTALMTDTLLEEDE